HFRLMAHARADLLALAGGLCDEFLDWEPDPECFTLRRVLRHVGSAEQWYVSRVVPPLSLPGEWRDDEGLHLWDFLEMERRTGLERLRALTPEERAGVFYPTAWTTHPDEAWTLRKVLRRFLEHERDHTGQVLEILELRRGVLLAGLHDAREKLLAAVAGLPAGCPDLVCGEWTARDLLGHLADWEWFGVEGLRLMGRGEPPLVELVRDIDAWNREHAAARRGQPWEAVLQDLHAARQALLDAVQAVEPGNLGRRFPFPWGGEGTPVDWLGVYPVHDREHAEDLAARAR
ncbi:MAG TPA: DinB family protein, partial [Anaerolineae bacterium]|nr:DinB family protein [Anaerolineae bacterium]